MLAVADNWSGAEIGLPTIIMNDLVMKIVAKKRVRWIKWDEESVEFESIEGPR